MRTVADAVASGLSAIGIRHAFGVVGTGNVRIVAALANTSVRYVPARHEGGAAAMADAYHRVSGDVGVCTVTYGPGLTNACTALSDAVRNRSAVVLLCGAPAVQRYIDIDQETLVASIGATAVTLTDPAAVTVTLSHAFHLARSEHRTVVLFLPVDLLGSPAETQRSIAVSQPQSEPASTSPMVEALAERLAIASRPLLLAGLGAWRARAGATIADLADRCGGLLAHTLLAKGIFGVHRRSLGVVGSLASPVAAKLIGDADLVIAFGTSMGEWTLHGGRLLSPDTLVAQIDTQPEQISPRTDLAIVDDAATVASALSRALPPTPTSDWRARVADQMELASWDRQAYEDRSTGDRIDPRTLTRALADLLPDNRTLVTDGGHFISWPAMYWPVADPSAFVFTGVAVQSIGMGFAGATGAAAARPDRTVVLAAGDGGALMGLSELDTLIRTAGSALVVVYDDAAYGAEVHMFASLDASAGTIFADTDFAGLAASLGARTAVVRTTEDLDVVRRWRDDGCVGTLLLDCKVVRDVVSEHMVEMVRPMNTAPEPA
nr:TPP-requiring enzyme co-localized with fatty acid metabolic genes [Kibdelosporangium sp. MJ126-NF4]CTQ88610.1 TPP-requiring enzyme co-localized with fatty acid metabolic genes [Kibdelosporangium sp. MJ126-NF4]